MTSLEKAAAIAGLALPLLAAAWWAGSGYVEFNDRLSALERDVNEFSGLRARYEREQAANILVNDQVKALAADVEWLKFHHHHEGGEGRPHVD